MSPIEISSGAAYILVKKKEMRTVTLIYVLGMIIIKDNNNFNIYLN